jgi:hypothetical protein
MQFKQGNNRHQSNFSTLEDQVAADNEVKQVCSGKKQQLVSAKLLLS